MPDLPPAEEPFEGWDTPRYTPIPDQLFDEWLPKLSEAELKVLLYIMRHTFGWKKESDAISLRQMADGCMRRDGTRQDAGAGVALRSIQRALPSLVARGLIEADKQFTADGDPATTIYRLRMKPRSQNDHTPGLSDHRGDANLAGGVRTESLQQETPVQETIHKNGSDPRQYDGRVNLLKAELKQRGWKPLAIATAVTRYRDAGYPPVGDWLAQEG